MRTVSRRPFREMLRPPGGQDELKRIETTGLSAGFRNLFYGKTHCLHPFTLCAFLLALGILLSLFGCRPAQIFVGALGVTLAVLYLRTQAIAEGVFVARIAPASALEGQTAKVTIEIRNASRFTVSGLRILDVATASKELDQVIIPASPLSPLSIRLEPYKLRCDAGMGPRPFGTLTARVSDPFGLFQFTITDTQAAPFEVLPSYTKIGRFDVPASLEAISLGLEDSPRAGLSTQFLGVREYRAGDSRHRIHWRISGRLQRLVVKEFETNVNSDVTLCLDMDPLNHIGIAADSSWEFAKDIAVSLLQDHLQHTGQIQLVSQGLWVPYGSGEGHRQALIRRVSPLRPAPRAENESILETVAGRVPFGSSVILITPIYSRHSERLLRATRFHRERGINLTIIAIEARCFTRKLAGTDIFPAVATANEAAKHQLALFRAQAMQLGIPVHVVRPGESLANAQFTATSAKAAPHLGEYQHP